MTTISNYPTGERFWLSDPIGWTLEEAHDRYNVLRLYQAQMDAQSDDFCRVEEELQALNTLFEEAEETPGEPGSYSYRTIYDQDGFEQRVAEIVKADCGIDIFNPPFLLWGAIDNERVVDRYYQNADGCYQLRLSGETYYID